MTLRQKPYTEDREISQAMDGDRYHQIFFFLVGDREHDAAHKLGNREVASAQVWQNKQ